MFFTFFSHLCTCPVSWDCCKLSSSSSCKRALCPQSASCMANLSDVRLVPDVFCRLARDQSDIYLCQLYAGALAISLGGALGMVGGEALLSSFQRALHKFKTHHNGSQQITTHCKSQQRQHQRILLSCNEMHNS